MRVAADELASWLATVRHWSRLLRGRHGSCTHCAEEESLDIHIISYFAVGVIFYISPQKSPKQITFLELRKNVWIIQSKPPGISHYVSVFYAEREMKNSCDPQEKNIAGVATIIYTPWTMNMCSEFHGEAVAVKTLANDRSPKVIISIWLHTIVQTKKLHENICSYLLPP